MLVSHILELRLSDHSHLRLLTGNDQFFMKLISRKSGHIILGVSTFPVFLVCWLFSNYCFGTKRLWSFCPKTF